MKTFHILNGDALKDNLPSSIQGELIVMREILIEGPIQKENFFALRSQYIQETYQTADNYYETHSQSELLKIPQIPDSSEINLWFEDDLFCQCNLWYCISQIKNHVKARLFLIRPDSDSWHGFGVMDKNRFDAALQKRVSITDDQVEAFCQLWQIYENDEKIISEKIIETLSQIIPRIKDVLSAHLDRLAPNNRPYLSLQKIMREAEDKKFPAVFRNFSKVEGIYGYGDSSIKRMYDHILNAQ